MGIRVSVLLFTVLVSVGRCGPILFDSFGPGDSWSIGGTGWTLGNGWMQGIGFRPSVTGTVSQIEIAVFRISGGDQLNAWLMADAGNYPGAIIDAFTLPNASSPAGALVWGSSTLHPMLTAGTLYWLVPSPPDIVNEEFGWLRNPAIPGVWNAQRLGASGPWYVWLNDYAPTLRVTGEPVTAIPEPHALVLAPLGLTALLFRRAQVRERVKKN